MTRLTLIATMLLAAALAWQSQRLAVERQAHANTHAQWAAERAATALEIARLETSYRALEGEYREKIDKIASTAGWEMQRAHADADRARTAAAGLQRDLAAYIDGHRSAAQARAAAGDCTPDTRAAGMLAELFRRADDRAGELARIADDARTSGGACERAYDAASAMTEAARDAQAR